MSTLSPNHTANERPSMASTTVAEGSPTSKPVTMKGEPRSRRTTFWLHVASVAVSVIYCIITGTLWLPKYGLTTTGLFASIGLIAPGLALVTSGGELITRLLRENDRGWHPAAHISMSLLTWLGGLGLGGFNAYLWGIFVNSGFGDWEDNCPDPDAYGFQCYGIPLLPQYMVLIIILLSIAIMHFTLFIIAIKQLQDRKALKRQGNAV